MTELRKSRPVHPRVTAVVDGARRRVSASENSTRYLRTTRYYADALVRGEEPFPPSLDGDPIDIAAHIEALAGLRRIAAARHPLGCRCESCRGALFVMTRRVPQ
ncbi:hypothetical protein ABZ312_09955 [Streptomyces sp. NPDC006207]